MYNSIRSLEAIIKSTSSLGSLSTDLLHKILFCSFAKAGLSLFGAANNQKAELEKLAKAIPAPYQGLLGGRLYLGALKFIRSLNDFLSKGNRAVILEEANLQFVLSFLRERVGKVGGVVVLDCGSIPELSAIASKFIYFNRNVTVYDRVFVNPIGMTRFLTEQLIYFDRETALKYYAELLKNELEAKFSVKISTIDLVVHQRGVTVSDFLSSLDMGRIFEQINRLAKRDSVLVTADHGYDLVADEHGLFVTHGYKEKCPLNFSRIALFLVID
jgi:hypothetical protein